VTAARPRVSIALPVYNGAKTIGASLDSALAQTYEDFELVVVDNASTDGTVEIVEAYDDSRVRLFRNPRNLGFLPNHNRSFECSRGELIKPLHADDRLMPHCVERMVEVIDRHPEVGLVFAARHIELADEDDPNLRSWRDAYAAPHKNFSDLQPVNDGRGLLSQYLAAGIPDNWVGEPSSVMVRRACIERIGLFSRVVQAFNDIDMSVRLMALYDVAFIEEPLSVFRREYGSLVDTMKSNDWLDRLWLIEGLAADLEMRGRLPGLMTARRRQRKVVLRRLLRIGRRAPSELPLRLRQLAEYAAFCVREKRGSAPRMHPELSSVSGG